MVAAQTHSIALLSIKPEFASRILSGIKRVEFRKSGFPLSVDVVLMYVCAPVATVSAYFTVTNIELDTPDSLWPKLKEAAGITKEEYAKYYAGSQTAVAIHIGRVTEFSRSVSLQELGDGIVPPQSFRYITKDMLDNITPKVVFPFYPTTSTPLRSSSPQP